MYQIETYQGNFSNFKPTYQRSTLPPVESLKWSNTNSGMITIIVRELDQNKMIILITLKSTTQTLNIDPKVWIVHSTCPSVCR